MSDYSLCLFFVLLQHLLLFLEVLLFSAINRLLCFITGTEKGEILENKVWCLSSRNSTACTLFCLQCHETEGKCPSQSIEMSLSSSSRT